MKDPKTGGVKFAQFTLTEEHDVEKIMARARAMFKRFGVRMDAGSFRMDLSACHASKPLDLAAFAEADDFNFSHDVGGIIQHLDRDTGDLTDCFVPRFAKRVPAAGLAVRS